jgi:hypothetical protein
VVRRLAAVVALVAAGLPSLLHPALPARLPDDLLLLPEVLRKFYYRSYFFSPPACAVGALPQGKYKGETGLFVFQNLHRYALYVAVIFVVILTYDAVVSFSKEGELGIGVGSIVLSINAILIGLYTFSCHSWRHLLGGKLDCFSCDGTSKMRHGIWKKISTLNHHHQGLAWVSMIWVMLTDLYVRLVSMGVINDLNTWG